LRFWITKNGELPVHEQLVRQVLLGILSEDLPAGRKLPSVRALARRHRVHSNTVSAAYHDLLERGWLELRRGSGLYVRPLQPLREEDGGLERLLTTLLQSARSLGHEPDEVLNRLEHLVRPRDYERVLIVEPEPAMREILKAEIAAEVGCPVDAAESVPSSVSRAVVVALPTRAIAVRRSLPAGTLCIAARLRSPGKELEGQVRPDANAVVSIVSRSAEIRTWTRAMLIAVGLDAQCLVDVDAGVVGWQERLGLSELVIADVLAARELPAARVARVIADSSLAELKRLCGG
jgi:DNA-binding transcriptional regulator YhcF (GntR family)